MMNYTKKILIEILLIALFWSCSQTKPITKDQLKEVLNRPFWGWTVEECDNIIKASTISNAVGIYANQVIDDVYIKATILDHISIPAIVRKEAILQRLSAKDFKTRLIFYLEEYTNLTVDSATATITEKNVEVDSLKGTSFQITFQNVSNPYRIIDVEDGYSYFFLENDDGDFSRVTEISGDYADNHFILGDYLKVTVTFSRSTDTGKILFPTAEGRVGYKIIFNGLQKESIILEY